MLKFAIGNLISRPGRSSLSTLGLAVAIAGMVGLFSIAGGIDHLVASTFELIPGLLVQQRGAPVPLFSTLPADWQREIEEIDGVSVVNAEVLVRANVIEGKTIISPPRFVLGMDIENRLRLNNGVYAECMEEGRFLRPEDVGTTNCVVSRQIAEEFGRSVGDMLRVNGYDVTIVGTYYSGSMLIDVSILMDINTVRSVSRYDPDSVSVYYLETTGEEDEAIVAERIERHFADRRLGAWDPATAVSSLLGPEPSLTDLFRNLDTFAKTGELDTSRDDQSQKTDDPATGGDDLASGSPDEAVSPIEVRSPDDWADEFDSFMADLDLFLTLMTGIGVAIAVLSIVNTMLMSVTERRIEFGILRANGWSRGHVLRLVTFESALLGIAGGLIGATLGWIATHVVNWAFPERIHLHAGPGLLLISIAFSALIGAVGGAYPAWLAARLSPMEAIRRG